MNAQYDLQRFVDAQTTVIDHALLELENGRKRSHWMWFIFAQLQGLGHSDMARRYGISGLEEALAYLQHSVLGPRLEQCCRALLRWHDRSAHDILGSPDDLKLKSSMTLFAVAAPNNPVFQEVIDVFFAGQLDDLTLSRLGRMADPSDSR